MNMVLGCRSLVLEKGVDIFSVHLEAEKDLLRKTLMVILSYLNSYFTGLGTFSGWLDVEITSLVSL